MKETVIYKFNDIKVHVEDLIEEYDDLYEEYLDELNTLNENANIYGKKKLRNKFRRLAYLIHGHSLDIIETLKKCNDYLYLNNHKAVSECDVIVEVDEFKYIRKEFKKNNLSQIKELYKYTRKFKETRNNIAHKMTEEILLFPIMNRENVLDSLKRYLYLLNKLNLTSEFSQVSKRNRDLNKQKSKASSVFNDERLIVLKRMYK